MSGASQNHDGAKVRPRRRQLRATSEATVMHVRPTVRFTPPCRCGWPMLKGELACLRCGQEREL